MPISYILYCIPHCSIFKMVRYSLLAAAFFCITTPALAGPVGSTYGSGQSIVINNDIPHDRSPCVDGLSCTFKPKNLSGPRDKRGPPPALQYNRYKNINKNRPSQSYDKDEIDKSANGEDFGGEEETSKDVQKPSSSPMSDGTYPEKKTKQGMAQSSSSSGYGTGREYGYPNKDTEGSNKGSFWGNSKDGAQRGFNCPSCHTDFDDVSSHIEEGQMDNDLRGTGTATDPPSETHKFILKAEVPRNMAALKNGPKFAAVCVVTQLSQMCIAAGNAVCSSTGTLDTRDNRCARACNCVRV